MSDRIAVCDETELRTGDRLTFDTNSGMEIALFNVEGEIYAINNHCAHMGGPICKGKVQGALKGEFVGPGQRVREYFSDELAVACPLHGWEYNLETGVHLGDDNIRLPTYDVTVEDGTVYVEL